MKQDRLVRQLGEVRDRDQLLRDLAALERLKEIQDIERVESDLAPRWWEALLGLLQFIAALGVLGSLLHLGRMGVDRTWWPLLFFAALFVLSVVLISEVLLLRNMHLRKALRWSLAITRKLAQHIEVAKDKSEAEKTKPDDDNPAS